MCSTPRTGIISAAARPTPTGDDICNGAVDNATGTVGAWPRSPKRRPKAGPAPRSLVFLAVTAEEQGLLGSEYYAANPVFPLDRTVGGVNIDTPLLAGPGAGRDGGRRRQERARRLPRPARSPRAAATRRPIRPRRPGSTTAPTISASPSAACRCSMSTAARTSSNGGEGGGRRRPRALHRNALSRARRRVRSQVGLERGQARPRARIPARADDGDQHVLAQLAQRRRIPPHPRRGCKAGRPGAADGVPHAARMGSAGLVVDRLSARPDRVAADDLGARRSRSRPSPAPSPRAGRKCG